MSENNRVMFLKGKKTVLRPVEKGDLPNIVRWINDPEVRYFLNAFLPQNTQDEEEWQSGLSKKKDGHIILIIETLEGQAIGLMGIHEISWRDRVATTGALIGEKEFWGKGYGGDAKMALLDYAFNTLNLHKICSGVLAFNQRSLHYSLKCGYKEEGVLRQHIFRDGKYHDMIRLAIFREDFEPKFEEWKRG